MTDTYTTKLDMQTGTINICGGDTRFPILIDEWPALMESAQAEYERAKAIMGNPLLDTRGVDEAMKTLYSGYVPYDLKVMADFYQNALVMLSKLETVLHKSANALTAIDHNYRAEIVGEVSVLNCWRDKIAAILEAHHHMPAIAELR